MYVELKINNIDHYGTGNSTGLNESFGNLYFSSFDKLIVTVQMTWNSPLQPKILILSSFAAISVISRKRMRTKEKVYLINEITKKFAQPNRKSLNTIRYYWLHSIIKLLRLICLNLSFNRSKCRNSQLDASCPMTQRKSVWMIEINASFCLLLTSQFYCEYEFKFFQSHWTRPIWKIQTELHKF